MRVTVLRGASAQSARKPSTHISSKESNKKPSIVKGQDVEDDYSIVSSPTGKRMHSAGTTQLQRLGINRRISQGSSRVTLASRFSAGSASSIIVARKSASYKRNVSFVHKRKRSISDRRPRLRSREHHQPSLTLQERYVKDQPLGEVRSYSQQKEGGIELPESPPVSWFSPEESPEPGSVPVVRSRKAPVENPQDTTAKKSGTGSFYFRDEARKVSTEMEKLCDEAFNKLPMSSSATTPRTTETGNRNSSNTYQTYDSSTTSFSVHEDLIPVRVARQNKPKEMSTGYSQRPLPKPPVTERRMDNEHLGSYTQRELAKTRALLKKRAAEVDMAPGYLDEIIAHLDRLMQPSSIRINEEERRAVSTPDHASGIPRKDTFEEILEKNNIGFRSTSEPTKRHEQTRAPTVRLVNSRSGLIQVSPVKPLTIRKKSEASTPSTGSPRQITPKERLVTTEELYRQQAEDRRSAGIAMLGHPNLVPIEEDEDKENFDPADRSHQGYVGEPKKRNWLRRRPIVPAPVPPPKDQRSSLTSNSTQDGHVANRKSDVPSQESQSSETKNSGRNRFLKIFTTKRNKSSQKLVGGDYDLDDDVSIATEDSSYLHNSGQAYMSGALATVNGLNVPNRGSKASKEDALLPTPPVTRAIQPQHQNWLARFLRIKPAVNVMCFCVAKVKARKEVASVFREWRKYGMRDIVVDKSNHRIWAKVDVKNCKSTQPFPLVMLIHSIYSFPGA